MGLPPQDGGSQGSEDSESSEECLQSQGLWWQECTMLTAFYFMTHSSGIGH